MSRVQALLIFHMDLLRQQQRGELLLDDRDMAALTGALQVITATADREGGDMERAGAREAGPALREPNAG